MLRHKSPSPHKFRIPALALLCGVVVVLFFSSCRRSPSVGLNPGEAAPALKLTDFEGKERLLNEFKGKTVLLNFWASWCATCVQEMPSLERLYQRFKGKGFEVIAVGVDDETSALKEFTHRYKLSFPVLIGVGEEARRKYGITGYPETFILDREGKILLFPDPGERYPTTRIVGPREWDTERAVKSFAALLGAQ